MSDDLKLKLKALIQEVLEVRIEPTPHGYFVHCRAAPHLPRRCTWVSGDPDDTAQVYEAIKRLLAEIYEAGLHG